MWSLSRLTDSNLTPTSSPKADIRATLPMFPVQRWRLTSACWYYIHNACCCLKGGKSKGIVIKPSIFEDFPHSPRFQMRLEVETLTGVGTSTIDMIINTPPSGGSCTVGSSQSTKLNLTCSNWQDDDSVHRYEVHGM